MRPGARATSSSSAASTASSPIDDVKRIVFDASYLVLGLGDVYLGAPVATPVDPRHRLVTTKYNPARTWTPENAVGIGGAYLCVYGMEGPGGYQFVGRTVQMWNTCPPRLRPGRRGCCASSIRSASTRSARRSCSKFATRSRTAATRCASRSRSSACASITRSCDSIEAEPRVQGTPAGGLRRRARALGCAGLDILPRQPESRAPAARLTPCRKAAAPCLAITASVWNIAVEPGQRVEAGQTG